MNKRIDYEIEDLNDPVEQAMSLFVDWAKNNNRNYFSDIVKENLQKRIDNGMNANEAFTDFISKVN